MSPAGPSTARSDDVARLAAAMLLSFEGSICLYQGEELGQTETDIVFHELTDPPGITFWPDYKGRDGCRTPMVWDDSAERRVHHRHALAAGQAAAAGAQCGGTGGGGGVGAGNLPRAAAPSAARALPARGRTRSSTCPNRCWPSCATRAPKL